MAGKDVRTIQRLEAGENASKDTLMAVAQALEVEVKDLLQRDEAPEQEAPGNKQENLPTFLVRITTGRQLAQTVGGCHAYEFDHEDLKTDEETELVAGFLQNLQDWGGLWSELESGERVRATRSLGNELDELESAGFRVFGGQSKKRYRYGVASGQSETVLFDVATVVVLKKDNPTITTFPSFEALFSARDRQNANGQTTKAAATSD